MTIMSASNSNFLKKKEWLLKKQNNLLLVFSPLLKTYPDLTHAFSTRQGGQSKAPYDRFNIGINQTTDENVRQDAYQNRQSLCQALKLPYEKLKTSKKLIHSTSVLLLEEHEDLDEVDAIATKRALSPIFMTFADCVPVIIYDPVEKAFCMVHAGWRGTAGKICQNVVKFLVDKCGSKPGNLVCAVGPAIGVCCYPVGLNVVEQLFLSLMHEAQLKEVQKELNLLKEKYKIKSFSALVLNEAIKIKDELWLLLAKYQLEKFFFNGTEQISVDLKAINAAQTFNLGVQNIDITNLCTACRADLFYSYRRSFINNAGPTGRQAAIASLL